MTRNNSFFSNISISALQMVFNQVSGVAVFLILSAALDKNSLGYLSWTLALLLIAFALIGFGLEQVVVKKTATGEDPGRLLRSYLSHVIFTGSCFVIIAWVVQLVAPSLQQYGHLFFWLSVSQFISFLSIPFRQIANGKKAFKALFVMACCGNGAKLFLLCLFAAADTINPVNIIVVYVGAAVLELAVSIAVYRFGLGLSIAKWKGWTDHFSFIKENLPQFGVVVFNTSVQRMDWLLLGLLSGVVMVADYSVTNRLYELAMLPLTIIAQVIFPEFAKLFGRKNVLPSKEKMEELKRLMRLELVLAVFVALMMNLCWQNLVDMFAGNKYGTATVGVIFIMSFGMPLTYLNNVFWSILFAQDRMRNLLAIFFITFLVNLVADLTLIPLFQAKGAAAGFVIALAVQSACYYHQVKMEEIRNGLFHLFPILFAALAAGYVSMHVADFFLYRALIATVVYAATLWMLRMIRPTDVVAIKKMILTY